MRICFIAPANNYHTKKWCNWFVKNGDEVHVISFINDSIDEVTVHYIDTGAKATSSDRQKLGYLRHGKEIKRLVEDIKPDIVNAHYASSYGAATALSGLKNYYLSVWGSDIYDFPQKSVFHKELIKYVLKKATYIMSTSKAMADETHKYTSKPIEITPFGVDMDLFNPDKRYRKDDGNFVIGNIKALSSKYGIDYLLKAASNIKKSRPDIPLKVRIAGKGPEEQSLKKLADDLGISDIVTWLGFIPQEKAAEEWANFDVGVVSSSSSESFGVSAVECQACGVPVIITDPLGLQEATQPGRTSVVVPRKDEQAIADAVIELYDSPEKRTAMGKAGRQFVESEYELNKCFEHISEIFAKNKAPN
jgi:L-malate glycosyltransferase